MSDRLSGLAEQLQTHFGDKLQSCVVATGEVTIEVASEDLIEVATVLRDDSKFSFEIMVDLSGVDYRDFGKDEWATEESSSDGFSRGVEVKTAGFMEAVTDDLVVEKPREAKRFASVCHLLSIANNQRLRLRTFVPDDDLPVVPSLIPVWNCADWYEREAFDLFGILYEGHPDLRRLLTDYGFIGHPFRKDFPLTGNVEVIYDAEKKRVVYQPVSIEPRVLVPKVIRAEKDEMPPPQAAPETDAEAPIESGEPE
jgi:NADH-quinone oxidoreductase subunit C